MTELNTK